MKNALDGVYLMPDVEFSVAVDDKGNWPNLMLLPNGEVLATFYNHPSHGFGCGDVELWVSSDDGQAWQFRSQVSDHSDNPEHCRMNHAFGRAAQGELLVLVSGWSEGRKLPILPVQVCISPDDGRTWHRHQLDLRDIPFGNIILAPDRRLVCAMYNVNPRRACILYESTDNGRTWSPGPMLGEAQTTSETALLRCRNGKWLAAARSATAPHLYLYSSDDEGRTWSDPRDAPLPGFPADLIELADGAILLTAGQRDSDPPCSGITACLSNDGGETWSPYRTLISVNWKSDHGYPSNVQLPDGTVLTAYYWGGRAGEGKYSGRTDLPDNRGLPWYPRYHMGVMRWRPERVFPLPATRRSV